MPLKGSTRVDFSPRCGVLPRNCRLRAANRALRSGRGGEAGSPYVAPPPALWIERREAGPYMSTVRLEAARRGLPAALLAELIGQESAFRNIRNESGRGRKPASSAGGLGQQLAGNPYLHGRSRFDPEASIAATAEELAVRLRAAHGNLEAAAYGYGLTAGLPAKARAAKLAALYRALAEPDAVEALR